MAATSLDLSQIKTDALVSAVTFRTLIGVYSEAEVDALAANYATAAQGALADSALQPSDITSGTITAGTGNIDFDDLGGVSSPVVLTASMAAETPLTLQAAASQTVPLQKWENSAGSVRGQISKDGWVFIGGGSVPGYPLDVNGRIRCSDALYMGGSIAVVYRDGSGYTVINSNVGTIITAGRAYATDTTAGFVRIDPGQSTGTGTPATVAIRRTTPTASGGGLQTLSDGMEIDGNTTSGETPLLLLDIDKGTLQRVSIGAADSGGTGYKVLRIPN